MGKTVAPISAAAPGKDPSLLSPDALCNSVGADLENGLTSQEARDRLAQNGPNELLAAPAVPVWRRIL